MGKIFVSFVGATSLDLGELSQNFLPFDFFDLSEILPVIQKYVKKWLIYEHWSTNPGWLATIAFPDHLSFFQSRLLSMRWCRFERAH